MKVERVWLKRSLFTSTILSGLHPAVEMGKLHLRLLSHDRRLFHNVKELAEVTGYCFGVTVLKNEVVKTNKILDILYGYQGE